LDLALKILTKQEAKKDYGDTRQQIVPIIKEYFSISHRKVFPSLILSLFAHIYRPYVLTPRKQENC
jgi:hypothetical protein